jgi:hypothetical protein
MHVVMVVVMMTCAHAAAAVGLHAVHAREGACAVCHAAVWQCRLDSAHMLARW